jgi:3-oxoadipate enol-lactonase
MPIVQADGCTINYEVEGPPNAPVLILSNSIATTLNMWDDQVPLLSKQFRLVRYDRRGHGKSAPKAPHHQAWPATLAVACRGREEIPLVASARHGREWLSANVPDR